MRTTNNGMGGTPDHKCSLGYCYGDYPQLGLDANGVYKGRPVDVAPMKDGSLLISDDYVGAIYRVTYSN